MMDYSNKELGRSLCCFLLNLMCFFLFSAQERFRTLRSSYYRGAQVYDVTRRDTFSNLSEVWSKEIDLYSTNQDCIRMLVGNKVDKETERVVTKKEGRDFAKEHKCLSIECSAKIRDNVEECFKELVLKVEDKHIGQEYVECVRLEGYEWVEMRMS